MNLNLRPHNRHAAFTLLEVILAVGVAALVLTVISSAFFGALRLRETTTNAVDEAAPVDRAVALLRRDLQCVVTPKVSGILSGDFKTGNVTSAGLNEPVAAELHTATGALSATEPWGDIQRVTYELKEATDRSRPGRDFYRSVTRNLLTTATPEVANQWLMSGVESVQFSCYDGAEWLETWDTSDLTSANTNLPVAVRVRIQLAAGKALIEVLVPIDSQSRTNLGTGS
jgi:type II secretion system protein J